MLDQRRAPFLQCHGIEGGGKGQRRGGRGFAARNFSLSEGVYFCRQFSLLRLRDAKRFQVIVQAVHTRVIWRYFTVFNRRITFVRRDEATGLVEGRH